MDHVVAFAILFVGVLFLILYVWSIVWAYSDAEDRGQSGCIIALLLFLGSWPLGLIAWLIFRPEVCPKKKLKPDLDEMFRRVSDHDDESSQ